MLQPSGQQRKAPCRAPTAMEQRSQTQAGSWFNRRGARKLKGLPPIPLLVILGTTSIPECRVQSNFDG